VAVAAEVAVEVVNSSTTSSSIKITLISSHFYVRTCCLTDNLYHKEILDVVLLYFCLQFQMPGSSGSFTIMKLKDNSSLVLATIFYML
jgi:hypothetical protein